MQIKFPLISVLLLPTRPLELPHDINTFVIEQIVDSNMDDKRVLKRPALDGTICRISQVPVQKERREVRVQNDRPEKDKYRP